MNLTTKSLIYNVSGIYKKQRGKQKLVLVVVIFGKIYQ